MRARLLLLGMIAPALLAAGPDMFTISPLFSGAVVLQRGKPIPIWGTAAPNALVSVSLGQESAEAHADSSGRWEVRFPAHEADPDGRRMVASCVNQIIGATNSAVIGDVWLCSGQSNMEWSLADAKMGPEDVAKADYPWLRFATIERSPSDDPTSKIACNAGWLACTPKTAGRMSAVGFYFARELHRHLGVPIGIINSSWGGTPIESWLEKDVLETTKGWPRFQREWDESLPTFTKRQAEYVILDKAWRDAYEASKHGGPPNPLPWPVPPLGPGTGYAPGAIYNGMIYPLAPFGLRGFVWYQGEANVGHADEYADELPAMITSWRARWKDPSLPFLIVQLPNFADKDPKDTAWAELRAAQARALALPNTAMAVTIDAGEANNLHPTDKHLVGERLGRIAAANVYGQPVVWSGPTVASLRREDAGLRVYFSHASGLRQSGTPTGFELAGKDKTFHPAGATLQGESILVSAPNVSDPAWIRYAWANQPSVTIYNGDGLPAAPFELAAP